MIEFGETLRKAREAKGLTPADISQKTHMMAQQVEALEREDFSRIVAPIYGRGFVKLYCGAVGIDPKPLVEAFMEIYSGKREPVIRRKETKAPAPAPKPEPEPEPGPEPQPEPQPAPEPESEPRPEPPPKAEFRLESDIAPAPKEEPPFPAIGASPSRYAPPVKSYDADDIERVLMLSRIKRLILLGAAAILILWALIAGCRAIVGAVSSGGEEEGEPKAEAKPDKGARTTDPVGNRIYMD